MLAAMRFLFILILCVGLAQCRKHLCEDSTNTVLLFKETDLPGTDLQFQVDASSDWKLELDETSVSSADLRNFVSSALAFDPSPQGKPLSCPQSSTYTTCSLKLTKTWDLEGIRDNYTTELPDTIKFKVTCNYQGMPLNKEIFLSVQKVNEFAPEFQSPIETVAFPLKELVEGFTLFDLQDKQAIDNDVGTTDGAVKYSVDDDQDLIRISGSKVVLVRNVTEEDLNEQGELEFNITAQDYGTPVLRGNMTLIVRNGDNVDNNNNDDGTDAGSLVPVSSLYLVAGISGVLLLCAIAIILGIMTKCGKAKIMKTWNANMRPTRGILKSPSRGKMPSQKSVPLAESRLHRSASYGFEPTSTSTTLTDSRLEESASRVNNEKSTSRAISVPLHEFELDDSASDVFTPTSTHNRL